MLHRLGWSLSTNTYRHQTNRSPLCDFGHVTYPHLETGVILPLFIKIKWADLREKLTPALGTGMLIVKTITAVSPAREENSW